MGKMLRPLFFLIQYNDFFVQYVDISKHFQYNEHTVYYIEIKKGDAYVHKNHEGVG